PPSTANRAKTLRGYSLIERVAEPWPRRPRGWNPRASIYPPAIYRCVSREGSQYRGLADLSRRAGTVAAHHHATNEGFMKKNNRNDIHPEYDFSSMKGGVRGRYA